jgi:hypothetical protein
MRHFRMKDGNLWKLCRNAPRNGNGRFPIQAVPGSCGTLLEAMHLHALATLRDNGGRRTEGVLKLEN